MISEIFQNHQVKPFIKVEGLYKGTGDHMLSSYK